MVPRLVSRARAGCICAQAAKRQVCFENIRGEDDAASRDVIDAELPELKKLIEAGDVEVLDGARKTPSRSTRSSSARGRVTI